MPKKNTTIRLQATPSSLMVKFNRAQVMFIVLLLNGKFLLSILHSGYFHEREENKIRLDQAIKIAIAYTKFGCILDFDHLGQVPILSQNKDNPAQLAAQ